MEAWKIVPSVPELEASSYGKIRLAVHRVNSRWKRGNSCIPKGYLYDQSIRRGYAVVRVFLNGKRKHFFVHRLVCEAFNGPAKKPCCCHRDGNSLNNVPSNLYWGTQGDNIADRERHGKTSQAEYHPFAKLKNKQVLKIKELLRKGAISQRAIAKKYGVTFYVISDIKRGKSWKSVK